MAKAQELAGDRHVSVAGAGRGVPWFAGSRGPVGLSDPEILADRGVTHLRFQVLK